MGADEARQQPSVVTRVMCGNEQKPSAKKSRHPDGFRDLHCEIQKRFYNLKQNTGHSPQGISDNKEYTNARGALRLIAHSIHSSRRGVGGPGAAGGRGGWLSSTRPALCMAQSKSHMDFCDLDSELLVCRAAIEAGVTEQRQL